MSKLLIGVARFLLVCGLCFLGVSVWAYSTNQGLTDDGVHTSGTVIELTRSRSADNSETYRPVVEFFDANDRRRELLGSVGSNPPSYSLGEIVDIIYDPGNPEKAIINSFKERHLMVLIFGVFGFVMTSGGAWSLHLHRRRRRTVVRLKQSGLLVQADFLSCNRDNRYRLNGRTAFRVAAQATHPTTGELLGFKSDLLWVDATPVLAGKKVPVLIDARDPEHYFVDLSGQIAEEFLG